MGTQSRGLKEVLKHPQQGRHGMLMPSMNLPREFGIPFETKWFGRITEELLEPIEFPRAIQGYSGKHEKNGFRLAKQARRIAPSILGTFCMGAWDLDPSENLAQSFRLKSHERDSLSI
jgi:hypothetical protein